MKDLKKNLKTKAKALKIFGGACFAALMVPTAAHAGAGDIVNNLVGYICAIFKWIGVLLLAWGVGQLVLAFKNEDADSKSRAMLVIIAAIILTSVGLIIQGVGIEGVSNVSVKSI